MNIVMMTNTYLPHVGGVANSVERFTRIYRKLGHRVLVVAPEFDDQPEHEEDVVRVPALQRFNGSDFAVTLPVFGGLRPVLDAFEPDIVHSHHPFLIGDTAIRVAASRQLPLVFTHHTMYEQYVHYVPLDAPRLKEFAIAMVTAYANQSDHVIAPSASIAEVLRRRGIETPISIVPTGVEVERFRAGDGRRFRDRLGIPPDRFVVGHVGRLAPEKNLDFLGHAVAQFCAHREDAVFVVVGSGPSGDGMKHHFEQRGLRDRLVMAGVQKDHALVDAYHAMDVFAFSSHSETQGMVLIEAMAAGVPVVALDAPGAREVVQDCRNGRLLPDEDVEAFVQALAWVAELSGEKGAKLRHGARMTGDVFSSDNCARHALEVYQGVLDLHNASTDFDESAWGLMLNTLREEWRLWSDRIAIATDVLMHDFTLLPQAGETEEVDEEDVIAIACPHCARTLAIPRQYIGSSGKCNHCGGRLTVTPAAASNEAQRPSPDTDAFPQDIEPNTLWYWIDREIKRHVPLQRLIEFLDERRNETRRGTQAHDDLDRMRRQLREGMLYRNWRARNLHKQGRHDEALPLDLANIDDEYPGPVPYRRAAQVYARHRKFDLAIAVCRRFLGLSSDPIQRERFHRRIKYLTRKRSAPERVTPRNAR